MTNFEKIKNMTVDEMADLIRAIIDKPEKFDDDICKKYCARRLSGICSVETCPYDTWLKTVKFWLENEA